MKMFWRCLIRDKRGVSCVEFVLVAAVFFMMIFGLIDFSRAMWEWNAAAKATQFGARHAVVSDIVSIDYRVFSALSVGLNAGDDIPTEVGGNPVIVPIFCSDDDTGPGLAIGCGTSLGGLAAVKANEVAFEAIVLEMQKKYGRIEAHNVVIEYRHIGLGFAGNPLGPDIDPLVIVTLRDMEFNFVTPGLAGLFPIDMPDFAASLTGEDHVTI